MEKKSNNFSMQEAMQLANTPLGQQLISQLQKSDPEAINKAMQQASAGNYAQIQQTLAPVLQSEDIKKLLRQLGG